MPSSLEELWPDAERREGALGRLAGVVLLGVRRNNGRPNQYGSDRSTRGYEEARSSAVLSARERDVLRAAAAGLTEPETAVVLGLEYQTVREYMQRARRKLGAKTAAQAVAEALRLGLIR